MTNVLTNLISAAPGGLGVKFDLVGPSARDDIRRAVNRYGREAVLEAVKAVTKSRRGRPKINDWIEIGHIIEADARLWLTGKDPFAARTNYAVAKDYADKNPGQSAVSTHQRIERKLAKKPYGRAWYTLVTAEGLSRSEYSWRQHIRALEALIELDPKGLWAEFLRIIRAEIADYEIKIGSPPLDSLSISEVQDVARKAFKSLMPLGQAKGPSSLGSSGLAGILLGGKPYNLD